MNVGFGIPRMTIWVNYDQLWRAFDFKIAGIGWAPYSLFPLRLRHKVRTSSSSMRGLSRLFFPYPLASWTLSVTSVNFPSLCKVSNFDTIPPHHDMYKAREILHIRERHWSLQKEYPIFLSLASTLVRKCLSMGHFSEAALRYCRPSEFSLLLLLLGLCPHAGHPSLQHQPTTGEKKTAHINAQRATKLSSLMRWVCYHKTTET